MRCVGVIGSWRDGYGHGGFEKQGLAHVVNGVFERKAQL